MAVRYALKTAPTLYPATVTELKSNLHLDATDTSQDTYLQDLLYAAVEWAQEFCGRQFLRATWYLYLDEWPEGDLEITKGPVDAITSISYYASGSTDLTAMQSSLYELDKTQITARVRFSEKPTLNTDKLNPVVIEFTCGWVNAAAVPKSIKDGVILYATERYMNPGQDNVNFGTSVGVYRATTLLKRFSPQRF